MSTVYCSRCVLDSTVPNICFDESGVCNYCHMFDALCQDSPVGEAGMEILKKQIEKVKQDGRGKKYDILLGYSGGTDSSYLLHTTIKNGLRPLCVHVDNGYDTDISTSNMKCIVGSKEIDVVDVKVNQDVLNRLFLAFMKAGLPWIDGPTDIALISILYRTAVQYGIRHIWVGKNFRTEGRQPDEWTHLDSRLIAHVWKRFGSGPLVDFANITPWDMFNWWFVHRIKMSCPLNLMDYNKQKVKEFLSKEYGWKDYGGHHHENLFTKFALTVWLYRKFGIDKRKITFSACVRSGEMMRSYALEALKAPPCSDEEAAELTSMVCGKLGISAEDFQKLMNGENKTFHDYPSYFPLYQRFRAVINPILSLGIGFKPMMTYEMKRPAQG